MSKRKNDAFMLKIEKLHQKLKNSILRTQDRISQRKEKYAKELADYEALYGKYAED
jgi:hypothetical protein